MDKWIGSHYPGLILILLQRISGGAVGVILDLTDQATEGGGVEYHRAPGLDQSVVLMTLRQQG